MTIGEAIKRIRESRGLTLDDAADELGTGIGYLARAELANEMPHSWLCNQMREKWGIDPHVLRWCVHGNIDKLPVQVRESARNLTDHMRELYGLTGNR